MPTSDRPGAPPRPHDGDTSVMLAVTRTRLALERTLVAWVRTAASMITFGACALRLPL